MKIPSGAKLWTVVGMQRRGGWFNSRWFSQLGATWFSGRLFRSPEAAGRWADHARKGFAKDGNPWQLTIQELTLRDDDSMMGALALQDGDEIIYLKALE